MFNKELNRNNICPICGNSLNSCNFDTETLNFLEARAKDGKIYAALSLAKIVWENFPQLKHVAESELLDGLAKAMVKNFQQEAYKILEPIKLTIEKLPRIVEKLPDDLRSSIQAEFYESRSTLEKQFKTIVDFSPKPTEFMSSIQTAFEQLNQSNKIRLTELEQDLAMKFKGTLEKMGFPEPEQMKLLTQLIPMTLPLLEELIRSQKIPGEKGKIGELELIQELRDYYPEDDCTHLGGSGDIDLVAMPRFNGANLGQKILIESKKNSRGWDRGFIQQLRRHMLVRGEKLAILAVETMPKSTNGFLIEICPEGTILVTDRRYFQISYGALRAAIIALRPFQPREMDFAKLFAEKKINSAIQEASQYVEWVRKIREKTQRIATNAKGIMDDTEQLDVHLKRVLGELQARINEAVFQIETTQVVPEVN
jgi:Uncharacterized protein conserved in bacteria (DUF2130)